MANTFAPFGAADFMHQGGSQRTEELRQMWVASSDATPIFNGDIVSIVSSYVSTGLQTGGFGPYITQATSGPSANSPIVGVFRGCELYNTVLQKMYFSRYWPGQSAAGTSSQTGDIKAFIVSDRSQHFLIQVSTDVILGASNVGRLFNVGIASSAGNLAVVGNPSSLAGNTTTGNSGMCLIGTNSTNIGSSLVGLGANSSWVFQLVDFYSNYGPGLLPGMIPGSGTGQFVNGMDNTTAAQYVIVRPWNWGGAL